MQEGGGARAVHHGTVDSTVRHKNKVKVSKGVDIIDNVGGEYERGVCGIYFYRCGGGCSRTGLVGAAVGVNLRLLFLALGRVLERPGARPSPRA